MCAHGLRLGLSQFFPSWKDTAEQLFKEKTKSKFPKTT